MVSFLIFGFDFVRYSIGADSEVYRCDDKKTVDRLWDESERMIREAGF